jgi:hypothetical protein
VTGFEPAASNSQSFVNKALPEKPETATGQKLPKNGDSGIKGAAEDDVALQQIIALWPTLPKPIQAAIKALIQVNDTEK